MYQVCFVANSKQCLWINWRACSGNYNFYQILSTCTPFTFRPSGLSCFPSETTWRSLASRSFCLFSCLSLNRSPNKARCGFITMVYLTNSSMQSTSRSRLPLLINRPISLPPSLVYCVYAFGIEDWLGMANIRIQRPKIRNELTVLKD